MSVVDINNKNKKTDQDNYLNEDPEEILTSAESDYKQYDKVLTLKKEVNNEIDNVIKPRVDELSKSENSSDHKLANLYLDYMNKQLAPAYGNLHTQGTELEQNIQDKMNKYNQIKNQKRQNNTLQNHKKGF